jgi:hypothetical protein
MNIRTQISLDTETQRRAHERAAELGISFAEYMRRLVANDLAPAGRAADISAVFNLVDEGPRTDIGRDKDRMIAEAVWREHRGKVGVKRRARVHVRLDGD